MTDHVDPSDASWTRVAITVAPEAAEVAGDLLWQAGAAGIEEQDAAGLVRLIGGFADDDAAALAVVLAAERGLPTELLPVTDDGLDAWRDHARAERAGRFWLVPAWLDAPSAAADDEVLRIDPGRTFGSGSHPTTRLVAGLLQEVVASDDRVLDVGCGSGVLAVVAARCGAASVAAIDIDPAAPAATDANSQRNGVGAQVHASTRPLADVVASGERFDVVAANLLAPVVAELGTDLVASLAPGGALVVSGLLADRWAASVEHLSPLRPQQVVEEQGWVAVLLR